MERLWDRVDKVTTCVHEDVMPVVRQVPKILPAVEEVKSNQSEIKKNQATAMRNIECLKSGVEGFKKDFDERYKPFLENEILTRVRWQERTQRVQTAMLCWLSICATGGLFWLLWEVVIPFFFRMRGP